MFCFFVLFFFFGGGGGGVSNDFYGDCSFSVGTGVELHRATTERRRRRRRLIGGPFTLSAGVQDAVPR